MPYRLASLLAATILLAIAATPASANTADQALATPYDYTTLFRAAGATSPDIWKTPIPASQPVDPNSGTYAAALAVQMGINPDGTWKAGRSTGWLWRNSYNVYVADAATQLKRAASRNVLDGTAWAWNLSFHNATMDGMVPVPTGALTYDGGGDRSMEILQPSTGRYFEFYQGLDRGDTAGTIDPATDAITVTDPVPYFFRNNMSVRLHNASNPTSGLQFNTTYYATNVTASGYQLSLTRGGPPVDLSTANVTLMAWDVPRGVFANYTYNGGGRIRQINGNPGYFLNDQPNEEMIWGRQASGAMPVIAGLVTTDQWNNPSATDGFGHVLSVQVRFARCGVKHWPAQRNDCGAGGSMPEGALFRFPASTDCTKWDAQINADPTAPRALYLKRIRGICVNGKVYGFRVTDQTGNGFAIDMESKPGKQGDGGPGGGQHSPNEYLEPLRGDWINVETMAENPHPTQWTPTCLC